MTTYTRAEFESDYPFPGHTDWTARDEQPRSWQISHGDKLTPTQASGLDLDLLWHDGIRLVALDDGTIGAVERSFPMNQAKDVQSGRRAVTGLDPEA